MFGNWVLDTPQSFNFFSWNLFFPCLLSSSFCLLSFLSLLETHITCRASLDLLKRFSVTRQHACHKNQLHLISSIHFRHVSHGLAWSSMNSNDWHTDTSIDWLSELTSGIGSNVQIVHGRKFWLNQISPINYNSLTTRVYV